MEFISNLIKRPISLVLSDSVEQSSQSSTPSAQQRERCSANNNSNNNNAQNILKNNNKNNMSNNNNSATHADSHEGNRNTMLPLIVDVGAGGDGLHTGHCDFEHAQHLNSSTSSNSTSSTIEELLIQINDNLNQANLQDKGDNNQVAAANEMSSGIALSPLAAKSPSTNKTSQSPHPQTPTTSTIFFAPPSPNVAAGSAVFETNIFNIDTDVVPENLDKTHVVLNNNNTGATKRNKFAGLTEFDESNIPELPQCLNPNLGEKLKLTFDEDLIPTLTASSNAQLDLPNKKDDATKTLQVINSETDTAVSSDNETYAECQSFPDLTNTTTTIDLGYGENNTSFSEADAYRSALNSYNNITNGMTNDNEIKQLDETLENVTDIGDEIFEASTKTTTEQSWQDMQLVRNEHQLAIPHSATFDDNDVEEMDVDMNETQELAYTTNIDMEAVIYDEIESKSTLAEFKEIPELNGATSLKVALDAKGKHTVASDVANEMMPVSYKAAIKDVPDQHLSCFELPGTNKETVDELNQTKTMTENCDVNLIQDNSVGSASDAISFITPVQEVIHELPKTDEVNPNELISSSVTEASDYLRSLSESELNSAQSLSSSATADNVDRKLNLTLEINTSFETTSIQQPPTHSPSFPIKSALSAKYFPRSPDVARPMVFLEKSDYSVEDVLIVTPSKKGIATKMLQNNLNKTVDMCDPAATTMPQNSSASIDHKIINLNKTIDSSDPATFLSQSPLATCDRSASVAPKGTNLSSSSLNCTFDGANSLPSPTMTSSVTDLETAFTASPTPSNLQLENSLNSCQNNSRLTINVLKAEKSNSLPLLSSAQEISAEKRRTFNASPTPANSQLENSLNSSRNNSRLTFNVPEVETDNSLTLPTSENGSQANSVDKRRTFNASPTPNSQLENSLNSNPNNSRLTFNILEAEKANSLPSSPPLLAYESHAISSEKRSTFNASPTPVDSQMENSSNSSRNNSRLTFNVPEVEEDNSLALPTSENESHAISVAKRRTFNASPTPADSQMENSLNSSRPVSRLTFSVPEPEDPVCNQSFEAMDVDSSIHAPPSPGQESPPSAITLSSIICSSSSTGGGDLLSAKEQTKSNTKDEKDIFVEKFSPSAIENIFKTPSLVSFNRKSGGATSGSSNDFAGSSQMPDEFGDEDFQNNLILNPSDFDYLLTKGNSNVQVDRSSLLLRFDPLLGVPIPANQPQQQHQQLQQILANNNPYCLRTPLEEEEHLNDNSRSFVVESAASTKPKANPKHIAQGFVQCRPPLEILQEQAKPKKNARMSVDVIKDMKIENDCNKSIENSNTQSDDIQNNFKMDDLEKKIKNEVLKTEDIEKKLKEAEQREEALIKRITEKDKTIAKMNGVIEAYEKAIAELISEKEQLIQNYEKQLAEVKADRDSNYHHLTSLETTFSDLHVKYEKSKEMTSQLKSSEESLLSEKKQNLENLRLQEQRYERMKNHAMQQLEIANTKLESLNKEHSIETTKLKALLKKEEISRASINEQLQQKSRENTELVKICDELINGQGS